MTKLAHVYERDGEWYYQSSSKTTTGLWIATPPLLQLDSRDSQRKKGEAALEVLNASQQGIPLPEDTGALMIPLLNSAGFESWEEFMKEAKGVGLELENNQLVIIPHRQIPRSKGALEGIEGQHVILPAHASTEQVGAKLEDAMCRCQ